MSKISGAPSQNHVSSLTVIDTTTNAPFALEGDSALGGAYVQILDASGNPIVSFGGGTQYTDGAAAPANPVGNTVIWNEGGTWRTVSTAKPLPVTANAGTNLNTSALALETGGNLATLAGGVSSSVYQMNVKQINGVTTLTGNGATGTGSQRLTLASDNSAVALWGHGATAATVPANATYKGVRGSTALPTAVSDGQLVGAMGDKFGRQVFIPNGMRDIVLPITRLTLTSSTTETSLIAAVASTFNDILELVVVNTSATGCLVDFRDSTGGTIRHTIYVPPTDTRGIVCQVPTPQASVNTAWTAQCGTSVASIIITGKYIANK